MEEIVRLQETNDYYKVLSDESKKKDSNSLVFQTINYSDEKVIEKVRMFEDENKENLQKEESKKIAYMSLFI